MDVHPDAGIRPSPIAGQWYTGKPDQLERSVNQYLTKAAADIAPIEGEPLAIIVPHAGHIYSGSVAAYGFTAIRHLQPEVVAVLSPLHQYARGAVYTSGHSAYQTPLGQIRVASDLQEALERSLEQTCGCGLSLITNDTEHAVEIELPFLQCIYSQPFRLLPLMVRDLDPDFLEGLGRALFEVLQHQPTIVVASTDLSHFYPQQVANQLDQRMLAAMQELNPPRMIDLERREEGYACGLGAAVSTIHYARLAGANRAKILQYATSGDITGDMTSVVGYGAIAITRA